MKTGLLSRLKAKSSIIVDAKRVIRTGLHNISGKEIHAKPLAQRENEKMEGGQLVSKVDYGKTVEICGDIAGLSKDALTVYLESRKGSGCGHIKDIDMTTNPPKAIFEDSEGNLHSILSCMPSMHFECTHFFGSLLNIQTLST